MIQCKRCGDPAETGAAVNLSGPATGHNTERLALCEHCIRLFHGWLALRKPVVIIDKQKVAERFLRKGEAQ